MKILKYLSASVLAALILLIIVSQTSFAETKTATSIEQQVGRLATALEGLLVQEKQPDMSQTMYLGSAQSNFPMPTCLDNYTTWKKSSTYKANAKWNLDFIPRVNYEGSDSHPTDFWKEQFVDLNGDSLPDYTYTFKLYNATSSNYTMDGMCVLLNNGAGFDNAYKCKADHEWDNTANAWKKTYYGDCAA